MLSPIQRTLLLLLFCMTTSLIVEAQPNILRRAENRVRNRANREVDKAIDRSIDQILTSEKDTVGTTTPVDSTAATRSTDEEPPVRQSNVRITSGDFEPYENPMLMSFAADIVTTRRNKEEKSNIRYTFDTWQTAMEMESEEQDGKMRIILDNQEGYMTTVTTDEDGETQAMRMRQRSYQVDVEDKGEETPFKITRTGNTRTIDGYLCEEVIIEHEDGTTTAWMTNDIDMDFGGYMRAFSMRMGAQKGRGGPNTGNYYDEHGFPVESTTVSSNGKETTFVHFYDILIGDDIDRSVFNLEGIEVMNLGF